MGLHVIESSGSLAGCPFLSGHPPASRAVFLPSTLAGTAELLVGFLQFCDLQEKKKFLQILLPFVVFFPVSTQGAINQM